MYCYVLRKKQFNSVLLLAKIVGNHSVYRCLGQEHLNIDNDSSYMIRTLFFYEHLMLVDFVVIFQSLYVWFWVGFFMIFFIRF